MSLIMAVLGEAPNHSRALSTGAEPPPLFPHLSGVEKRFRDKWKLDRETGCHIWTSTKRGKGYGEFRFLGKKEYAHRAAWRLYRGPIPKGSGYHGVCVLHICDNPLCVNPAHLFLGSNADNVHDMLRKGRGNRTGSKGRLSAEQVKAIRACKEPTKTWADRLGMSRGHIRKIKRGYCYKGVA